MSLEVFMPLLSEARVSESDSAWGTSFPRFSKASPEVSKPQRRFSDAGFDRGASGIPEWPIARSLYLGKGSVWKECSGPVGRCSSKRWSGTWTFWEVVKRQDWSGALGRSPSSGETKYIEFMVVPNLCNLVAKCQHLCNQSREIQLNHGHFCS